MNFPRKRFAICSLPHASRAKALLLTLSLVGLSFSPAAAIISEFRILDGSGYEDVHAKYKPTIKENEKNPLFVDVRVPFIEDSRAYWLVTASKPLDGKKLNFRSIAWGDSPPEYIQSFVRLGESLDLDERPPKRRGYIEFTVSKKLLPLCYIYHDYESIVDDGFFYYTYDLSKHKVEQGAAPANADKKALLLKPTSAVVYDSGAQNGIAYVTAYLLINDTEMIISRFTLPTEYTTTPIEKQSGEPSDERKPYSVDLRNLSVSRLTGPDIKQHIYRGGVAIPIPDGSYKRQSFVSGTGVLAGRRGDLIGAISLHNIDFGDGKLYETTPVSFNSINIPVP